MEYCDKNNCNIKTRITGRKDMAFQEKWRVVPKMGYMQHVGHTI